MSFAENTKVPIGRTQDEIKKILSKHGATGFVFGENQNTAMLMFDMASRRIKIAIKLPQPPSPNATQSSIKTYEQIKRSKWRCLLLVVKAKLEAVESGITSLEHEFMANILLPNGKTVFDNINHSIKLAYETNTMPKLLE